MKVIYVQPHIWEVKSLYQSAQTPAQRDLAGYIIKTGNANNPICGAAFSMLREIESCRNRGLIYQLLFVVTIDEQKQILKMVETALNGGLHRFSFTKREMIHIITLF